MISNPELADRISSQVQTAEIRLPRDGGPIEVTIDLTNLVAAASARPAEPDMAATLEWTVTAPVETVDITVPTDAADRESCA